VPSSRRFQDGFDRVNLRRPTQLHARGGAAVERLAVAAQVEIESKVESGSSHFSFKR